MVFNIVFLTTYNMPLSSTKKYKSEHYKRQKKMQN